MAVGEEGSPGDEGAPPAAAKEKEEAGQAIPYWQLFNGAERFDYLLMLAGSVAAIGNGAAWPIFAILFGRFSNTFGGAKTATFMDDVTDIALSFLWLAIGAAVCSYLQASMWMLVGSRVATRMRTRYLSSVLRQDIAFYDTQATTGKLLQGLNDDSVTVQQATSEKVAHFIQHSSTFIIGWIVAFVYGWDMTLVMVGCLPALAAVGAILSKVTVTMTEKAQASYTQASTIAQQALSQIRTVVSYGGEEKALDQYKEQLEGPVKMGRRQGIFQGLALGGINAIVYYTYAIAFFYGAWRVSVGAYTGGQVMQVLVAALLGGFSLGQASPVLQTFNQGRSAGGNMFKVIDRKPAIDLEAPGEEPAAVVGEIELRNVRFAYPARPDVYVFKDFSLTIPAGKTVALVGSSGSGKSTVVGLIERFYDPAAGCVLLDGRDLRSLQLKWLRNQVGLVSQEPTLFATTIFENIAMGRPGAGAEEVEAAARAANAHGFISLLPEGYNTQCGERGLQLSGGQKQRIAIARAILKNPRVLCLDEATSALDTQSERVVQEALDRMVVGRTTVVVAHRLSTIQHADCIAVVREGQVVEQGTHEELTANPVGVYTALVRLQMQHEDEEHVEEALDAELAEKQAKEGDVSSVEEEEEEENSTETDSAQNRHSEEKAEAHKGVASPPAPSSATLGPHGRAPNSKDATAPAPGSGIIATIVGRLSKEHPAGDRPGSGVVGGPAPTSATAFNVSGGAPGHEVRISVEKERDNKVEKHGGKAAGGVGAVVAVDEVHGTTVAVAGGAAEGGDGAAGKAKEANVPLSRLIAYNKPEWPYAVFGVIASAANGVVQPAFAFVISSIIVVFYGDPSDIKSKAGFWSLMFFTIGCGTLIAFTVQQYCFGCMGQELARRIRVHLFRSILYQEVGWFDLESNSSGVLTSRLASDASYVRGAVGDTLSLMLQNILCLAFGYLIAFAYMWRMALVVTGALPFILVGAIIYYKTVTGFESGTSTLYASANQAVSDAFSSVRVVQAYNLHAQIQGLYGGHLNNANRTINQRSHLTGALMGYSQFSTFAVYALIIWFGGYEVDKGHSSFEDMLKAFLAVLLAALGIAQAQVGFPDMGKAKAAITNVFPIIDRRSLIDASSPDGLTLPEDQLQGELELQAVRFVYPARPSVIVFRHFSLTIPAGQTVALVGESGSGKSTIVGLIERFYDPVEGRVLLDGRDLRSYNLRWLRSRVGLVSQEPLLFSCSVLDNIRYGRPDASMEEVVEAARAANVHDLIEGMPDKYDTQVGERGVQLSGGQKQRVAIARAVLKRPKILLLDEATSALDAQAERLVQEALDGIMARGGLTSVVVAHRLSTIRNAHKIALVHRGSVLETGTHEELMAMDGGYAKLVEAQLGSKTMGRTMGRNATAARQAAAEGAAAAAGKAGGSDDDQPALV